MRSLRLLLVGSALLGGLACSDSKPSLQFSPPLGDKDRARAIELLSKTSPLVQREVYRTCEKWKHIDHPCDDVDVRNDQLRCFLGEGVARMEDIERMNRERMRIRPRARDLKILRGVNMCMEKSGWRKVEKGRDI